MSDRDNPNPRYFRCTASPYIINFEKIAMIFVESVQVNEQMEPALDTVSVCVALDGADKAFRMMTPRHEFIELMSAYEKWLSER